MTIATSPRLRRLQPNLARPKGLAPLLASEVISALMGFAVLILMARTLGPEPFAAVESAAAVVAVLLVLVRSGVESIVIREASRHPRLIAPLTETLIACKLACAGLAYVGLIAFAWGSERLGIFAVAGLVLFPSALIADVGPRALGRLGPIAASQVLRAIGLLAATLFLVRNPTDTLPAAACVVLAESVSAIVLGVVHWRTFGPFSPRFRRWVLGILGRRSGVASLSRLGRVFLYGADLLALSIWGHHEYGHYAASRRVVFAMIALGLVVPGAFAPAIAAGWARGADPARKIIRSATFSLMSVVAPATLGLVLTAPGWMVTLFGPEYRSGGIALMIVAARSPFLLLASFQQASLVAMRREGLAFRLVLSMLLLAAITLPASAAFFGPVGAGVAMFGVEAFGAILGWLALRRLDVAPPVFPVDRSTTLGCLAMTLTVLALGERLVWVVSLAGAAVFVAFRIELGRGKSS